MVHQLLASPGGGRREGINNNFFDNGDDLLGASPGGGRQSSETPVTAFFTAKSTATSTAFKKAGQTALRSANWGTLKGRKVNTTRRNGVQKKIRKALKQNQPLAVNSMPEQEQYLRRRFKSHG